MKLEDAVKALGLIERIEDFKQAQDLVLDRLLNSVNLIIVDKLYQIIEAEMYYRSEIHLDPFIHIEPPQLTFCQWYVHRSGRGGIDFTIGDGKSHGGILIRSIKEKSNGTVISGPLTILRHLQTVFGISRVELQKKFEGQRALDGNLSLQLISATLRAEKVYFSPRVGLTLQRSSEMEMRKKLIMSEYRATCGQHEALNKIQTIYLSLLKQGMDPAELRNLLQLRESESKKYEGYFQNGLNKSMDDFVGMELGTTELCELYGSWFKSFK